MGYNRYDSATQMRAELCQDSLSLKRTAHTPNEMYKIMNDIAPAELSALFKLNENTGNHSVLRSQSRQDLKIPKCNLASSKRNFVYRGSVKWNNLPLHLRNSDTLAIFKKAVLDHLRQLESIT